MLLVSPSESSLCLEVYFEAVKSSFMNQVLTSLPCMQYAISAPSEIPESMGYHLIQVYLATELYLGRWIAGANAF